MKQSIDLVGCELAIAMNPRGELYKINDNRLDNSTGKFLDCQNIFEC